MILHELFVNYEDVNENSKDLSIRSEIYNMLFPHLFSKKFPCPFPSFTFHCICENAGGRLFVKKVVKVLDIHTSKKTCVLYSGQGNGGDCELGIKN